jgi:hypothetical protein
MSRPAPPAVTVRFEGVFRSFEPGRDVVVGRDHGADIRVNHRMVSRAHAVLRYDEGRWVAIDNGSRNGMFVDNRRVPSAHIRDGQSITLGTPFGPVLTFIVDRDETTNQSMSDVTTNLSTDDVATNLSTGPTDDVTVNLGTRDIRRENVFRKRWRDRQSAGARPGELVKQAGWTGWGLAVMGVLVFAGVVVASTVTIANTQALPALAHGRSVIAARTDAQPPDPGTTVQFRDASGTTFDAVVVEVSESQIMAELDRPVAAPAGDLVIPAPRQRLIAMLLPRLW